MKNDFIYGLGALVGGIVGLCLAIFVIFCVLGYPIMWMWNYTLPHISAGYIKEINVYQAICLIILARLFFTNFSDYKK
jgi:hypothetical protein